jgi:hypothetical protein
MTMETAASKATVTARPARAISPAAARVSIVSGATFLALLAALHFIKPELDPSWRAISEYALGEHGWIMTIAFLAWGLSALSLFVAIRSQVRTRTGRLGLGFLLVGAAGPLLAGLFPTDPITTPTDAMTTAGTLHALGAVLGDAIPVAATLLTLSLVRKSPGWSLVRRPLIWATVLAWVGFVVLTVSMFLLLPQHGGQLGPEVLVGWQNRFMVVAYAAWPMTAAWCALRVRALQTQDGEPARG